MKKKSIRSGVSLVISLLTLSVVSLTNHHFEATLGLSGITLLYLLAVMGVATFFEFPIALITAILAFLSINFFFIEPRYTFVVASLQSWVSLCCFLIASLLIASLVKQLKYQKYQAINASNRAQFSRLLAEKIAISDEIESLFEETCLLMQREFQHPIAIACTHGNSAISQSDKFEYIVRTHREKVIEPDQRLFKWVCESGKAISPYTDFWTNNISDKKQWLIPFNRLPSHDPILIVDRIVDTDSIETFHAIRACVDQISQSYLRLVNLEKTQQAELKAQEESIQNALLASISHDMRTPLTTILGAATTLEQISANKQQDKELVQLIASQARYLAQTTENILALVRLESNAALHIAMDWQTPEELVEMVIALDKSRGTTVRVEPIVIDNRTHRRELLIQANAGLIVQALINLIDNAQRVQSSLKPIQMMIKKMDQQVSISVEDHGPGFKDGFSVAEIKKFSTSQAKGFGLGLSIVKAIAKAHHATLTIDNKMERDLITGACVTLTFQASSFDEFTPTPPIS
jgi:two-component system sensor histidine kinase KdpD